MKVYFYLTAFLAMQFAQYASAIFERGDWPWETELRSYYDQEMADSLGKVKWYLNLGPTGIRAQIYPEKPNQLAVKYVFQDAKSPAKGLIEIGDVIVGANGKKFKTSHRFGRNLPGGGGWDGPMLELAGHIEDSQGEDGKLHLMVWPAGKSQDEKDVTIELRAVGRFAPTFPYNCERSEMMLEELCDFIVMDYESGNWKQANQFYGGAHNHGHQLLALMASGMSKYDKVIKQNISQYYGRTYDPADGGFKMWKWGYDGIIMGEYYLLEKDRKLLDPMESLAKAMPDGSHNGNGIYTHRSYINIRRTGKKPYASIAAISGLNMLGMSLFKEAGLPYDERLYNNIHQHYLNSATPDALNIAYAFSSADRFNDADIAHRHAIIILEDESKGLSGRGPGYVCPTGMEDIGEYTLHWPTKADPRWKPTDWIEKERDTNIVTELQGNQRRIDRANPRYKFAPEPTKPYKTTGSGRHLAPVGMGAVAHLIGNNSESWEYLGRHAANTCVLGPGNGFDGHAASNLSAFWSVIGAAQSDDPEKLREYLDYMKTFLILSETHNGGLILQPWGRDRAGTNSDVSYGPRTLQTATGAILLALGQKKLMITGAGSQSGASDDTSKTSRLRLRNTRKARELSADKVKMLDDELLTALGELSISDQLKAQPVTLSRASTEVWLVKVGGDNELTFQALSSDIQKTFAYSELTTKDRMVLSCLVAKQRPEDMKAQAAAGIFLELTGETKAADEYFGKLSPAFKEQIDKIFE